jgi:hypothetical protein
METEYSEVIVQESSVSFDLDEEEPLNKSELHGIDLM